MPPPAGGPGRDRGRRPARVRPHPRQDPPVLVPAPRVRLLDAVGEGRPRHRGRPRRPHRLAQPALPVLGHGGGEAPGRQPGLRRGRVRRADVAAPEPRRRRAHPQLGRALPGQVDVAEVDEHGQAPGDRRAHRRTTRRTCSCSPGTEQPAGSSERLVLSVVYFHNGEVKAFKVVLTSKNAPPIVFEDDPDAALARPGRALLRGAVVGAPERVDPRRQQPRRAPDRPDGAHRASPPTPRRPTSTRRCSPSRAGCRAGTCAR